MNGECVNHIQYIDTPWRDGELCGYTTPGWYFWSECDACCYGPYGTRNEARTHLIEYTKQLLTGFVRDQ